MGHYDIFELQIQVSLEDLCFSHIFTWQLASVSRNLLSFRQLMEEDSK